MKIKNLKNEDGVSPVIGVILMVAITVVLAAIVAVFVFNLDKNTDDNAIKGSVVKSFNGYSVKMTNMGGNQYRLEGKGYPYAAIYISEICGIETLSKNEAGTNAGEANIVVKTSNCKKDPLK